MSDANDSIAPGGPLTPDAPPSIIQEQGVGSHAWQNQKLFKEDRRLERVAEREGARARLFAESRVLAGSAQFADLRADATATRIMKDADGNEREYRIVTSTDNPTQEADARKLEQYHQELARRGTSEEPYRPRAEDAGRHRPEKISDADRAKRDEAVRRAEAACEHDRFFDTTRGMVLIRICRDCGLEAHFGPDGVAYVRGENHGG